MAKKLYEEASVQAIAGAIRAKNGSGATYKIGEMAAAVRAITGAEAVAWHQCPEAVRNYLAAVTYDADDDSVSHIAEYAPGTAVAANSKPVGVTRGGTTYCNERPNVLTPFASGRAAGTLKPLDALRWLNTPQAANVRDLGGWACDGGTVRYGLLFRGGEITAADRDVLVGACGVRHELNLRGAEEANRTASPLGSDIRFCCPTNYVWYSLADKATWKEILLYVIEAVTHNEPVYFHCSAGADRTGTVACLLEALLGMSRSDIDKDYELTCFSTGTDTDAHARRRNETDWKNLIAQIGQHAGDTFRDKAVNFATSCGVPVSKINAFRAAMIDGTPDVLSEDDYDISYTVTRNLANGITTNNAATSVERNASYAATLTAGTANNAAIKSVKVTMGGVDITEDVVTLTPYTPTPPIVTAYTVTNNLANVRNSNSAQTVNSGSSYATTLTPTSGYVFVDVEIQMGGVDITATVYSSGNINIPKVTGNIVIYATAATNQLPLAVDTGGSLYNGGQGWKAGYRLNSSGVEVAQDGAFVTGFMPFKQGDTMALENVGLPANESVANTSWCYVALYDANKTKLYTSYSKYVMAANKNNVTVDANNYVTKWTLNYWPKSNDLSDVAFVRLSTVAMDGTSKVYIE